MQVREGGQLLPTSGSALALEPRTWGGGGGRGELCDGAALYDRAGGTLGPAAGSCRAGEAWSTSRSGGPVPASSPAPWGAALPPCTVSLLLSHMFSLTSSVPSSAEITDIFGF